MQPQHHSQRTQAAAWTFSRTWVLQPRLREMIRRVFCTCRVAASLPSPRWRTRSQSLSSSSGRPRSSLRDITGSDSSCYRHLKTFKDASPVWPWWADTAAQEKWLDLNLYVCERWTVHYKNKVITTKFHGLWLGIRGREGKQKRNKNPLLFLFFLLLKEKEKQTPGESQEASTETLSESLRSYHQVTEHRAAALISPLLVGYLGFLPPPTRAR